MSSTYQNTQFYFCHKLNTFVYTMLDECHYTILYITLTKENFINIFFSTYII